MADTLWLLLSLISGGTSIYLLLVGFTTAALFFVMILLALEAIRTNKSEYGLQHNQ